MPPAPTLALRPATAADVPALAALINRAYRGESSRQGWTTEADLLDGPRIDEPALHELLGAPGSGFVLAVGAGGELLGCVFVQPQTSRLYLGTLAVAPGHQAHGIGRQLLEAAGARARQLGCSHLKMTVLTGRPDLLAWYERRGYALTGAVEPYPATVRFGRPRRPLALLVLEKPVPPAPRGVPGFGPESNPAARRARMPVSSPTYSFQRMDTVAPGVTQLRIKRFVNVYFVDAGTPGEWVLVDTGLPGSEAAIRAAAEELYGPGAAPQAILLTHGHLDHLGSALALATDWQVPVIVHPLELPYVTAQAPYPPRDPTVGGSLAFASRFFPTQLPNLSDVVQPLPVADDTVPYLLAWRWLHVPGHAPGQVAFFRPADRTLLGADAFATTHHDSLPAVLLGLPKISRAGTPFNYDWAAARRSVQALAALNPAAIGCGHGPVMQGPEAAEALRRLAADYPVPAHGRYIHEPARTDASGVEHLPPPVPDPLPRRAAALAAGLLVGIAAWQLLRRQSPRKSAR